MNKQQIKWHLQIIFVYYTSYADRNNYKLLKQQNYRRFLIDAECIKQQSSLAQFDIAFQKINHSAIIFKDFLKLIPDIAELVFKGKYDRTFAFKKFMNENITLLYNQILEKSQFGQDVDTLITLSIDKQIQSIIMEIQPITKIYQEHIGINMNKQIISIFQSLTSLLKDLQVCPQIVSKALTYIIFLNLIKDKDMEQLSSTTYSLNDFVRTLISISEILNRKLLNSQQLCPIGKITRLFERIEISTGFQAISKKNRYESALTYSILKSFNLAIRAQDASKDHCIQKQQQKFNKMFPSTTRHKNCNNQSFQFQSFRSHSKRQAAKTELKMENQRAIQYISQESSAFQKGFKEIKQAFQQLCSYGEVANSKTLKSFKIKKLFQRTGLTSLTGQAWLDIQIVNLQRCSESGKIQFPQFLQLISLSAKKAVCPFDQLCEQILKDKIITQKQKFQEASFNNYSSRNTTQIKYSHSDIQLLKQILNYADKGLLKIYQAYSHDPSSQKLMNFNQLCKAMYDFQVFPSIINKNRLYHIFTNLNNVREQSQQFYSSHNKPPSSPKSAKQLKYYLKQNKKIQYSGFLMAIIQIAQEIIEPSLVPPQKLILLLQKINQSKGYKKIITLNLVQDIRKKFGQYYMNSFNKNQKASNEGFDQLLDAL